MFNQTLNAIAIGMGVGFFDLKEDFTPIGLGVLPAYWFCLSRPVDSESRWTRVALTLLLAFIVW
jgi:hypothetical protein